jgi:hypothetical protein
MHISGSSINLASLKDGTEHQRASTSTRGIEELLRGDNKELGKISYVHAMT